jgi:hypothetical protein
VIPPYVNFRHWQYFIQCCRNNKSYKGEPPKQTGWFSTLFSALKLNVTDDGDITVDADAIKDLPSTSDGGFVPREESSRANDDRN